MKKTRMIENSILLISFLDVLKWHNICKFDLSEFEKYAKQINCGRYKELTITDIVKTGSSLKLNDRKRAIDRQWIKVIDTKRGLI